MFGWQNSARAVASRERPWRSTSRASRPACRGRRRGAGTPPRPGGGGRGRRRPARVWEQVVGPDRSRSVGPARGRAVRRGGAAGADVGVTEVVDDRAGHDRSRPVERQHVRGGLLGVAHATQDDHQPVALRGAERVDPGGAGNAAYLVEGVAARDGRAAPRRVRPSRRRGRPSPGRSLGTAWSRRPRHAAPSRRRGLEAGVPGAAYLGGAGVDLGGGEGGLAAVRRTPACTSRTSAGSRTASRLFSTTSMPRRTRSTVCWRLIAPASARGAAPKTWAATAEPSS